MAAGDYVVRRNASNTDAVPDEGSGDLLLLWDTAVANVGSGITYSSGTFTLGETGHFLVLCSDHIYTSDTTINERRSIRMVLTLGGTELQEGRCTGYIRQTGGAQEWVFSSAAIINVTSTTGNADDLQVRLDRTDTSTTGTVVRGGVEAPASSGITILKLDDTWDYGRYESSADTRASTTDNAAVTMNLQTQLEEDATFTRTTNTIDVATNNLVLACWTLNGVDPSYGTRSEFHGRLTLAGTVVPGSYNQTYLRGTQDGCTYYGMSGICLLEPTSGDDVELEVVTRESGTTGADFQGSLQLVELPAAAKACIVEATTGNFNAVDTDFVWDTNPYIDTDVFTHTAGNANLDVDVAGDYLVMASLAATTGQSTTRGTPAGWFRVNTTDITHAGSLTYNRNTGTAEYGALNVGTLLNGLSANDSVYFRNDRWATATANIINGSGGMALIELDSLSGNATAAITAIAPAITIDTDGNATATITAITPDPTLKGSAYATVVVTAVTPTTALDADAHATAVVTEITPTVTVTATATGDSAADDGVLLLFSQMIG